jgi:GntR family transcriptional regulator
MYRHIAENLRRRIEAGEFEPGSQLPTELELREDYGGEDAKVSRNTVRDAIKLLVARGLVETRPGQGTFVCRKIEPFVSTLNPDPDSWEGEVYKSEVERQGRTSEDTDPRVEVQPASGLVARYMELGEGAMVISRHQQRRIDRIPWSLQTTFYPMDLLQKDPAANRLLEARSIKQGVIQWLRENLGINQVGWRDTIIARPPTVEERAFFDLSDKVQVAVFEFRRTGYDENGKPIRFTVTVYPADRNLFELKAGHVPEPRTRPPAEAQDGGRARSRPG